MFRIGFVVLLAVCILTAVDPAEAQPGTNQFDRWDQNNDGRLTRDELPPQIRRNFDRVDTDGDGFITRAEDRTFRQRNRTDRPQRNDQRTDDRIRIQRDIPYADSDNPRQMLDLFLPAKRATDGPLPMVVWIHGGAWRAGSKAGGLNMVRDYVAGGQYAGASIGYRLSGEAIWPAQIHDCKAAIRWLRAHAEEHNIDPDRIGVWGSSAGGHLVAMLGTSGDVEKLEGDLGKFTDTSSRVNCVVDYYGPSDLPAMGKYPSRMDHDAADSPESKLVGGPVQETLDAARGASPITYTSKDDPPMLIVHGTSDPLVPYNQSERLTEALRKAGAPTRFITITEGGHGGFRSDELLRQVRIFFDKHLRDVEGEVSEEKIRVGQ